MTPSKINLQMSDAESDVTVRPLRLLGQQAQPRYERSPVKSRSRTPSRNPAAPAIGTKTTYDQQPGAYRQPFRLDDLSPAPSLLDSRVKQSRRLDALEETPAKTFSGSGWPQDSFVTPMNQASTRRVSSPDFEQTIKVPQRIVTDVPRDMKGSIFITRPHPSRTRNLKGLLASWNWRQIIAGTFLLSGFLTTLTTTLTTSNIPSTPTAPV